MCPLLLASWNQLPRSRKMITASQVADLSAEYVQKDILHEGNSLAIKMGTTASPEKIIFWVVFIRVARLQELNQEVLHSSNYSPYCLSRLKTKPNKPPIFCWHIFFVINKVWVCLLHHDFLLQNYYSDSEVFAYLLQQCCAKISSFIVWSYQHCAYLLSYF